MNPQMMMQNMMQMMRQAGNDSNMMRLCKAAMSAPIFLDSPAMVRGQAESLGLSEEQMQKLLDIEKAGRQKARSVLTEEQIKEMGEIPDEPMAIMEMCQQMCGEMMPMMRMMMGGQSTPQGVKPKQNK
jgi:hypothetical protein